MRVISLLRSVVVRPRRRPIGVLAILTVIIGVVTMHSMSGSPTLHLHHVPHEASVASAEQPVVEPAPAAVGGPATAGHADSASQPGTAACHDGCGGHDLATAMCLMILVALLALVVPARRLLWRAPIDGSMPLLRLAPAGAGARDAPSLHELCISRT